MSKDGAKIPTIQPKVEQGSGRFGYTGSNKLNPKPPTTVSSNSSNGSNGSKKEK